MYKIIEKDALNSTVSRMVIKAPLIAQKAEAGQFVIVRAKSDSERIPLTIADYDRDAGLVTIIFQLVGGATAQLNSLDKGDSVEDFVGPLGRASDLDGVKKAAVVGGGVGCAIALPVAKKLHQMGAEVDSVIGFRDKELVILEKEFEAISGRLILMTDDGSAGDKGFVTDALQKRLDDGANYDRVIAIGPVPMMQAVVEVTRPHNIPTTVSMNSIMVDGTGMCGGCRLTVDGETKFACVDGPEFDGFLIDFDEAIRRGGTYRNFEQHMRDDDCNLYNQEVK